MTKVDNMYFYEDKTLILGISKGVPNQHKGQAYEGYSNLFFLTTKLIITQAIT